MAGLDGDIIHIGFDFLVELPFEAELDSSLIGGVSVLQPERHHGVVVSTKWVDDVISLDLLP
jgi:hypothetical protein